MAGDMFLKIEGIAGESQDTNHSNEIDIESFGLSMTQSETMQAGDCGPCQVSVGDIFITKRIDKATPALMEACATGATFPSATMTVRRAGGNGAMDYLSYTLKDVRISSYNASGAKDGLDRVPESISLHFQEYRIDYTQQNADGTPGVTSSSAWNVAQGVKV